MMKKIVLTILSGMLFMNLAFAQEETATPDIPVDEETKLITYRDVVKEEGTTDDLYLRGINWVNKEFKNPAEVTRVRNRESGIIKGLHRFKIRFSPVENVRNDAGLVQYEFVLEFKEGRYRYTFTSFILKDVSRQPIEYWLDKSHKAYNPMYNDYLEQVDAYIKAKIETLAELMKPEIKKDDDW